VGQDYFLKVVCLALLLCSFVSSSDGLTVLTMFIAIESLVVELVFGGCIVIVILSVVCVIVMSGIMITIAIDSIKSVDLHGSS
jgi:hypothetical protein